MCSCIILSHGTIAQSILEACNRIAGEQEHVFALNCEGQTPKGLRDTIVHLIESENLRDGLFIFVSLKGGSCWNAAARIVKEFEKVQLLSGVNLPLILSFIMKRDKIPFEELGKVLVNDAIRGIARISSDGE